MFERHWTPLKEQIEQIEVKTKKRGEKISNLEDKIDKLVEMAKNLNKMWLKGGGRH